MREEVSAVLCSLTAVEQPYGLRHPTVHCLLVSCICALLAIYTDPPGIPISQSSPRGIGHLPSVVV